jgi:hypothetical protein
MFGDKQTSNIGFVTPGLYTHFRVLYLRNDVDAEDCALTELQKHHWLSKWIEADDHPCKEEAVKDSRSENIPS